MPVDHHALLLTSGLQAVGSERDARWSDDEQFYVRKDCREFDRGSVAGIGELVGKTDAGLARTKSKSNGVMTLGPLNGRLGDGHAGGTGGGHLVECAFLGDRKFEIAVGAEEGLRGLRIVLHNIFF